MAYSTNRLISFFQHIGHDLKVVFTDTETVATKLPTVIADVDADTPGVTAAVVALYSAGKKLFVDSSPVQAAVEAGGTNLGEDALAIADEATLQADILDLWAKIEALEKLVVGDVEAIGTAIK